jgi:phosphoribosylformylglycinamidine cyclo-ligase
MSEYEKVGVDYGRLDETKRVAIRAAGETSALMAAHSGKVFESSRGASAFVFELGGQQLAFVVEGLGTKAILARLWAEATGEDRFGDIGIDAVAAIVNDVCSVGALPVVVNAYVATGGSDWHEGQPWLRSLLVGFGRGCRLAEAVWGGGESPALPKLVSPPDVEVAGASIGVVPSEWGPILGDELRDGDAIVLIGSSGLHANGASLARAIAEPLEDGLRTTLPSGISLGDALLRPSVVYVSLVAELRRRGIRPSYLAHVTGHGFRKLMRAPADLVYVIEHLPPPPECLEYLVRQASMNDHEAYGTFNMGVGFAIYVPSKQATAVVDAAQRCGMNARVAGHVESGTRAVELTPLGVTYIGDEMDLG